MGKKRVLCFASYFLPGFRAGGPIRSLKGLIDGLSEDFEFRVVTRDRDLAGSEPYPDLVYDRWSEVEGIGVWYLRSPYWAPGVIRRVIADYQPDLLYFHSFVDPSLVAMPLLLRRLGIVAENVPALVAPRGEFAPSALALKGSRKSVWLVLVRSLGLYRGVTWQATNELEATQIYAKWRDARVLIAPNLSPDLATTAVSQRRRKVKGALRLVFLSRISPMKNLDGALRILGSVSTPVSLDIYGTQESAEYWAVCERAMQSLPAHIKVTYRGAVPPDEVIDVFASYDVFFLPTLGENFGHAILESLRAGCPVLISDRTPWRQMRQMRAGYDLSLDQPGAFVAALEEFAKMDDAQFQQWSDGAARVARQYADNDALRSELRAALNAAMA